jgi:shikimate kinase
MGRAVSGPARRRLIFLVGPRGSGKTTVARLVAGRLGWQAVDADEVLEQQTGRAVSEVFAAEGEEGFRSREARVLAELAGMAEHVVATGGGVVLRPDNRELLRRGWVVWLSADADTLWARVQADGSTDRRRPALTGLSGRDEVAAVLREREPLYRGAADLTLDTAGCSPEDVAAAVLAAWQALVTLDTGRIP